MSRCSVYIGLVVAIILTQLFSFVLVLLKWDLTNIKHIPIAILIPIVTILTVRYLVYIIKNRKKIWN